MQRKKQNNTLNYSHLFIYFTFSCLFSVLFMLTVFIIYIVAPLFFFPFFFPQSLTPLGETITDICTCNCLNPPHIFRISLGPPLRFTLPLKSIFSLLSLCLGSYLLTLFCFPVTKKPFKWRVQQAEVTTLLNYFSQFPLNPSKIFWFKIILTSSHCFAHITPRNISSALHVRSCLAVTLSRPFPRLTENHIRTR